MFTLNRKYYLRAALARADAAARGEGPEHRESRASAAASSPPGRVEGARQGASSADGRSHDLRVWAIDLP